MDDKRDINFWRDLKVRPDYTGLEIMLLKRGKTKTDLKEEVGIASGTLAKIRKKEYLSLELLLKIAVYLNCSVGDLVDVHPADRIKDKP